MNPKIEGPVRFGEIIPIMKNGLEQYVRKNNRWLFKDDTNEYEEQEDLGFYVKGIDGTTLSVMIGPMKIELKDGAFEIGEVSFDTVLQIRYKGIKEYRELSSELGRTTEEDDARLEKVMEDIWGRKSVGRVVYTGDGTIEKKSCLSTYGVVAFWIKGVGPRDIDRVWEFGKKMREEIVISVDRMNEKMKRRKEEREKGEE